MKPVLKSFFVTLAIMVALIAAYVGWTVYQGTPLSEIVNYFRQGSHGVMAVIGIVVFFLIAWGMLSWNFRIFAEQKEMFRQAEEKRRLRQEKKEN